jgi:hypothetical protein
LHLQKGNTVKGLAVRDEINVRYHDKEGQTYSNMKGSENMVELKAI